MRTGRPLKELTLSADERLKLEQWARRPKSAQRLALRSRIVLACASGLTNTQVAHQLRVTMPTVGKWRSRFLEDRLEGQFNDRRHIGKTPILISQSGKTQFRESGNPSLANRKEPGRMLAGGLAFKPLKLLQVRIRLFQELIFRDLNHSRKSS
jgi:hypothetical protein